MSASDTRHANQTRTYDRANSVVFLKTDAPFGGLSNMAAGFPLRVNGIRIRTSEALYQACRFPHRPEIQTLIIEQTSPMTAKMKGKPYRHDSRPDWDQVRVKIMRWCLRVKLAQNWRNFSALLLETGDRSIVEESRKDEFWGAKASADGCTLIGMNVLGRLLMELREAVKMEDRESLIHVEPLGISDFLLAGRPIDTIALQVHQCDVDPGAAGVTRDHSDAGGRGYAQPSLFDETAAREAPPNAYSAVGTKRVQIADLKPYAGYKESELPWLGKIPRHWIIKRGKSYMTPVDQRSKAGKEELLTVSSARGVVPRSGANVTMFKAKSYAGHKLCWPGDLVINSLWAWAGGLGVSQHHGIISTAYSVYRGRPSAQVNPKFLHELVRSSAFQWELHVRSKGVWVSRLQLTDTSFLDAPIPLPPPDEQAAIVRFLDWANGRLERAIRAKRKVIALLNEQKQAIIHRAVTRGLDPDVPLKPSGIPWLGDIPQHWEVRPLKQLLVRMDYGTSENVRGEGRVRVLTMGHIRDGKVAVPGSGGLDAVPSGLLLEKDDLLFNRTNSPDLVGKVGLFAGNASDEITFASYLVRLRARTDHNPVWMNYLLNSSGFWSFARSQALVSLHQANLNSKRYGQMVLPVPCERAEQDAIVEHLQAHTSEIDLAISRLEREIELLREYRTRLVADVVTGKLDVREAAARLPDESAPEPLEDDAELAEALDGEDEEAMA